MPLNDLSLDELKEMADTAATLARVGDDLLANGLTPTFDLSPGKAVTIHLDAVMPEAAASGAIYISEGPDTARAIADALNIYGTQETLAEVLERMDQNSAELFAKTEMIGRQLNDLQHRVEELSAFREMMAEAFPPTPGLLMRRLDQRRHNVDDLVRQLMADNPVAIDDDTPSTEAAPVPAGAVAAETPVPVDAPPADEGPAGGHPQSSAVPSRSADVASPPPEAAGDPPPQPETAAEGVAEDSGGGQEAAAPASPAAPAANTETPAPIPGSASALAASTNMFGQKTWTPEEDDRLINLVVMGMHRLGLGKMAAMKAAAQELGRPFPGTEFRCKNAVRARLEAALAQGSAYLDKEKDLAQPDPAPAPEAAPVAAQSFTADPVTAHLMALTDKGGWTLDRDLELMELSIAGWAPNEIALQIQMQAGAIKPRFDALTGLYTDASDKKQRRFSREAVFEALTRLTGKAA